MCEISRQFPARFQWNCFSSITLAKCYLFTGTPSDIPGKPYLIIDILDIFFQALNLAFVMPIRFVQMRVLISDLGIILVFVVLERESKHYNCNV